MLTSRVRQLDQIGDGADADLYEAINESYDGALEWNGVISNIDTLALDEMSDAVAHAILTCACGSAVVDGKGAPGAAQNAAERLVSHFRR